MELSGWLGLIVAAIGGPTAVTATVQWMVKRAEKRRQSRAEGNREWEAKLTAREAALDQQIADSLRECKESCAEVTSRADKLFYVVVLIFPEVQRLAPESQLLRRAQTMLSDILPVDPQVPADMQAQLDLLDQRTT